MVFSYIIENFAERVHKIVSELEKNFIFEFFDGELVSVHGFLAVDVSVLVVMVEKPGDPSSKEVVRIPGIV